MPADTVVLRIPIHRWHLLEAGRRRDGGDQTANPLEPALKESSAYVLYECGDDRLELRHFTTGRHYAGPVPAALALLLARFRAGGPMVKPETFELVLVAV